MLKRCGIVYVGYFRESLLRRGTVGATSFPEDGLSGRALLAGVNLALEVSIKEGSLQWAEEVESEDEMDPKTDPESDRRAMSQRAGMISYWIR